MRTEKDQVLEEVRPVAPATVEQREVKRLNSMHCRLEKQCEGDSYCACSCTECVVAWESGAEFYGRRREILRKSKP